MTWKKYYYCQVLKLYVQLGSHNIEYEKKICLGKQIFDMIYGETSSYVIFMY